MSATDLNKYDGGAVRYPEIAYQRSGRPVRYDLVSAPALRRLAETYAEGAAKYGDRNWEKGLPTTDLLNHAFAHVVAYMAGERDEDHLAHAAWGLFALMHFEETGKDRDGRR